MTAILVFCVVVVLVLALAIWAIRLLPLTQPLSGILQAFTVVIAILIILNRLGLL